MSYQENLFLLPWIGKVTWPCVLEVWQLCTLSWPNEQRFPSKVAKWFYKAYVEIVYFSSYRSHLLCLLEQITIYAFPAICSRPPIQPFVPSEYVIWFLVLGLDFLMVFWIGLISVGLRHLHSLCTILPYTAICITRWYKLIIKPICYFSEWDFREAVLSFFLKDAIAV